MEYHSEVDSYSHHFSLTPAFSRCIFVASFATISLCLPSMRGRRIGQVTTWDIGNISDCESFRTEMSAVF
jgi:hypothetical protein